MKVALAVIAAAAPPAVVAYLYSKDRRDARARQLHEPARPPQAREAQPAYGRYLLFVVAAMFLIGAVVFGLGVATGGIDNVASGVVIAAISSLLGSMLVVFGLEHARKLRQRGL